MKYNEFEKQLKGSYLFIFDTNIFLELYRLSTSSSRHITELIEKLVNNTLIPNQVYIEFIKNYQKEKGKQSKKYEQSLKELKSDIDIIEGKAKSKFFNYKKYDFPQIDQLENNYSEKINDLKKVVDDYLGTIQTEIDNNRKYLIENDVLRLIEELKTKKKFTNGYSIVDKINMLPEAKLRFEHFIPPGYKDNEKPGLDRYGDYFLWKEIIDISNTLSESNLFFVTNDEKEDWYHKNKNGLSEGPRKELLEEFFNYNQSRNNQIFFLNLKTFNQLTSIQFYFISN